MKTKNQISGGLSKRRRKETEGETQGFSKKNKNSDTREHYVAYT
jgi:hypothetical protein